MGNELLEGHQIRIQKQRMRLDFLWIARAKEASYG